MRTAVASKPVADYTRPDTVVSVSIDPATGFLAAPDCPARQDEYYIAGTEPTEYCPKHGGAAVKPLPLPQQPLQTGGQLPETGVLPSGNTPKEKPDDQ